MRFASRSLLSVDRVQPINWRHRLNHGLVSHWLTLPGFSGGQTWFDLCRRNNATLHPWPTDAPTWQGTARQGGIGQLLLDSSDDFVSAGTGTSIAGEMTVLACVKPANAAGGNEIITNYNGGSDYRYLCEIGTRSASKASFVWGGAVVVTGATSIVDGVWINLAFVRSGSTGSWTGLIYLNGQLDASSTTATDPGSTDNVATFIGTVMAPGPVLDFAGAIDDVCVFNRALSAAEIAGRVSESSRGYPSLLNRCGSPLFASSQAFSPAWLARSVVLGSGVV